jgi:hypothetical protein
LLLKKGAVGAAVPYTWIVFQNFVLQFISTVIVTLWCAWHKCRSLINVTNARLCTEQDN